MAVLTNAQWDDFQQDLLKAAAMISNRQNNLVASAATMPGGSGGTGETFSTLITSISAYVTALG